MLFDICKYFFVTNTTNQKYLLGQICSNPNFGTLSKDSFYRVVYYMYSKAKLIGYKIIWGFSNNPPPPPQKKKHLYYSSSQRLKQHASRINLYSNVSVQSIFCIFMDLRQPKTNSEFWQWTLEYNLLLPDKNSKKSP